jgi:hypothetical protein
MTHASDSDYKTRNPYSRNGISAAWCGSISRPLRMARVAQLGQFSHRIGDPVIARHTVELVHVDVVGAEPTQTRFAARADVSGGSVERLARLLGLFDQPYLDRDNPTVTRVRQSASEHFLAVPIAVDIRGVDEGEAQCLGFVDDTYRLVIANSAPTVPHDLGAD